MPKMTAYERYRAKTLVPFQLALNRNTDGDILEWLESQPSKAGAVKAAIRAAMLQESAPAPKSAPVTGAP